MSKASAGHPKVTSLRGKLTAAPDGAPNETFELSNNAYSVLDHEDEARELITEVVPPSADTVLKVTGSLCPDCVAESKHDQMVTPMVVYEEDDEIRMVTRCEEHGLQRDVYWGDAAMYYRAKSWADNENHVKTYHHKPDGQIVCPTECGLCPKHKSHSGLGNIVVTNRCDRSCYYCFFYAEEGEALYEPSKEQIEFMAKQMASEEPIGCNAIQITGGEATLREDICEIIEIVSQYVDHVQLNTHSSRFMEEPELAKQVRDAGTNVVYTSFDGLDPQTGAKNYYEFPHALSALKEADLGAVLVPTVIGNWNEDQVGDIVRFAAANNEIVRGVNFQPVSLVGRMPQHQREQQRVTIPDVIHDVDEQTGGEVPAESWFPVPACLAVSDFLKTWKGEGLYELTNNFACGMATYVFLDGNELVPITDVIDIESLLSELRDIAEEYQDDIGRIDKAKVSLRLFRNIRGFMEEGKVPDSLDVDVGQALFEAFTKGTYDSLAAFHKNSMYLGMMHFQDPYNYDLDRIEKCDIHYAMPDGRVIPFCSYNVVPELYRDWSKEEYSISVDEWLERDYTSLTRTDAPNRTNRKSNVIDAQGGDHVGDGTMDRGVGDDDEGIFGLDVKHKRGYDEDFREMVHEAYRASVQDGTPVWETVSW